MSINCFFGKHTWNGCRCVSCGKTRDEQHNFEADCEKCAGCGKLLDFKHDWKADCERCLKCGKTRENGHNFSKNCERCSSCGKTKDNQHLWVGCTCQKCKSTRDEQHPWNGCTCSSCGKTRDEFHDWSQDCEECSVCKKRVGNAHSYENGVCIKCGLGTINGTFVDERDGHEYKTVRIGKQVMMAENLAFQTSFGKCWAYHNNPELVPEYGLLYDLDAIYSACKDLKGWHLPSFKEWKQLLSHLEGLHSPSSQKFEILINYSESVKKEVFRDLKKAGNSGFNAALAGYNSDNSGLYSGIGSDDYFWTSTPGNAIGRMALVLSPDFGYYFQNNARGSAYSIRLFKG